MAKFFVDGFADMFGKELLEKGLTLAPSKILCDGKVVKYEGKITEKQKMCLLSGKLSIGHITQEEWIKFFTPFLEDGEDIAFFTVSQRLFSDGAVDLRSAFGTLERTFPKRKIKLVNTFTVSRAVAEIASMASLVYKKEQNFDSAIKFATKISGSYLSCFVVEDNNFISKNAILSGVGKSLAGSLLNVKPIICIDKKGNFRLLDKARGFKAAVKKLFSVVKANGENIADYTFSIVESNAKEEAENLKEQFLKIVEPADIRLTSASLNNMTILGPKFVAVTFHGKELKDNTYPKSQIED